MEILCKICALRDECECVDSVEGSLACEQFITESEIHNVVMVADNLKVPAGDLKVLRKYRWNS